MPKYISLLRGINVSGQKKIKMADLRTLYESLGFHNVKTYIQSGNVIFDCDRMDSQEIKDKIERGIAQTFGFHVPVLIRMPADMQRLLENNPFFGETRQEEIKKLYVTFLVNAPPDSVAEVIKEFDSMPAELFLTGKEIYLFYPNGYGRSKLNNNLLEKKLGVKATTRNWRTVNKLLELSN